MGPGMIEARSLRVDYDDVVAVRDVDFTVRPGEVFGLVGPNGAGKTSTIRAVAGLIEPTYGEVRISGADMELHPEEGWRHLGYMPDFPPLYEGLRVWECLEVFAAAHLIPRAVRLARCRTWVERVGLGGKWDAKAGELSRGMRQRLVLAATLLHEPSVVMLDEPASGMDPIARVELREILKDMAARGCAVLVSSHILTELSNYCTAIGVMEKGRMVAAGTVEEIRSQIGSKGLLRVRLVDVNDSSRSALRAELAGQEMLRALEEKPEGTFSAQFAGDDASAGALLAKLVAAGIRVADFHVEHEDIEDLFMRIGAREVS